MSFIKKHPGKIVLFGIVASVLTIAGICIHEINRASEIKANATPSQKFKSLVIQNTNGYGAKFFAINNLQEDNLLNFAAEICPIKENGFALAASGGIEGVKGLLSAKLQSNGYDPNNVKPIADAIVISAFSQECSELKQNAELVNQPLKPPTDPTDPRNDSTADPD